MVTKIQAHPLVAGDRIRISTPGGGGYGDPLARPPDLVAADVRAGYYSPARAAADYGVAVTATGELDLPATVELRATRRPEPEPRS